MFGKKNPSAKWERTAAKLTVDWDNRTLNDVALGEPLDSVSFLGPDEDPHTFRQGELSYYSQGLVVEFDDKSKATTAYHLVLEDPDNVEFTPYSQSVIRDGRSFSLPLVTRKNLVQELGEPFWVDEDDDEAIAFYEFPGAEWQLEFDADNGSLKRLIITKDPIMAKDAQRESYNVTKPYPY